MALLLMLALPCLSYIVNSLRFIDFFENIRLNVLTMHLNGCILLNVIKIQSPK